MRQPRVEADLSAAALVAIEEGDVNDAFASLFSASIDG